MRTPVRLALLAVAQTAVPSFAQKDPPPPVKGDPPAKVEPKLKIGDPAPPLTVGKWHQGPEVKAFEKDKVYVVVCWEATSGDPHALLRTLNTLHAKHKEVVPVAVMSPAAGGMMRVPYSKREAEMVAAAKPKFTYAFGDDDNDATAKAYGAEGVEHRLYVVGKDGTVAFVAPPHRGNSMGPKPTDFLPDVLPKVLDGSWKGQKDADALADAEKEFQKALSLSTKREEYSRLIELDSAKGNEAMAKWATEWLSTVDEFLKSHPTFAKQPRTLIFRADKAAMSGQKEVATKAVEAVIADAEAHGVVSHLLAVADIIASRQHSGRLAPEMPAAQLVDSAITAALKIELSQSEWFLYERMMTPYLLVGNVGKGRAVLEKACENAPSDRAAALSKGLTEKFEMQIKMFEEDRKRREKK